MRETKIRRIVHETKIKSIYEIEIQQYPVYRPVFHITYMSPAPTKPGTSRIRLF